MSVMDEDLKRQFPHLSIEQKPFCTVIERPLGQVPWYHVDDPTSGALDELARRYHLHELPIEDAKNGGQRAKIEEHPHYLFVVLKRVKSIEKFGSGDEDFQDFDCFISKDFLITVCREKCNVVEPVKQRAMSEKTQRLDRIFYMLVDRVVDDYVELIDRISDQTSDIEAEVLEKPTPDMLSRIFAMKRRLVEFRRVSGNMRELVNQIMRREQGIVGDDLDPYWRDVYDHLLRTVELIESYRDLLTGSLDIYLSATANRTNEIVKRLTVMGTVATPLVIITGFFGMNLKLPLQDRPHGLAIAIVVMIASMLGTWWWLRRQGAD